MRRLGPGWSKVAAGLRRGSKVGVWGHASGWRVSHCGHPTALWPYYLSAPSSHDLAGRCIVSFNGLGFASLVAATTAVELVVAGEVMVTGNRCVPSVGRVLLTAAATPAPPE